MRKGGFVYILTNPKKTVLYTGVTNNLERRIYEHKQKKGSRFTQKYNCTILVYFEETNDIQVAIEEEKKIKAGSRQKKIDRIERMNPSWNDLSDGWFDF